MRTALASLLAVTAVAAAAHAQTPPATPPEAAPAAASAAPAAVAPMAPATAPAPAAAAPAEPPPVLPTTGDGAQLISVIDNICVPLVRGGDIDQLTAAAGYKKNKREGTYIVTLGAKPYTVTINSQGSNKAVCRVSVTYAVDGEKPIISALNIWAFLHKPMMLLQRNDFVPATDFKRITTSWEYYTAQESIGLVFLQLKKPDGSPVTARADQAELLYSERKF